MPARRWWIVVILAAVFTMHGVLLVPSSGGNDETGSAADQHAMAASDDSGPLAGLVSAGGSGPSADIAAGSEKPMFTDDPGHGVGMHVWSLCLAILAGLALVGALVLTRRVAAALDGAVAPQPRGFGRWFRVPRPPDLASLCLLRI